MTLFLFYRSWKISVVVFVNNCYNKPLVHFLSIFLNQNKKCACLFIDGHTEDVTTP